MLLHSGHILLLAKRSFDRSLSDESEAMPAIILAAMALECFVNEVCERTGRSAPGTSVPEFPQAAYWFQVLEGKRATTLEKILAIRFAFTGEEMDKGSQPYQDLAILNDLRNSLVHRKPESIGDWTGTSSQEYVPHKFVKVLASRGVIDLPPPEAPPVWSQFVIRSATAKWAYNTSLSGMGYITSSIPNGFLSYTSRLMIDGTKQLD